MLAPNSNFVIEDINVVIFIFSHGLFRISKNVCTLVGTHFGKAWKKDIIIVLVECDTIQINKGETTKIHGALQPLSILANIWTNISIDFIVGIPNLGNKSIIMIVVDRISKYAHFYALQHPFASKMVAQIFLD